MAISRGNEAHELDPRQIIIRPIVTEKSMRESAQHNKYFFRVHPKANKIQIARAVETIFNVRVLDVNTAMVRGKTRRRSYRHRPGQTPRWKKAVVTLAPGSTIDVLAGG